MKLLSFLASLIVHAFFVLIFLLIIKTPTVKPKKTPIYTVSLIKITKKQEKKVKTQVNKTQIKPKPTVKPKQKPKPKPKPTVKPKKKPEPKPKPKPKPKVKQKPKPKPKQVVLPKKEKPKPKKPKQVKKPKPKKKEKKRVKVEKKVNKPKPKKKAIKPNIEEKIKLLKEKIMLQQIREKLLREKIKLLREHILTQEEAQKRYAQKLAHSYIALIKSIIYNHWGVEKSVIKDKVFIAKVKIKLDYNGNLVNLYMIKSSGNSYFDGTVMDAIKSSEPFPPPPKEILTGGFVDFIITFDSREKQ